ncbi:MAG TPA: putative porin [Pyrinomonadaceae bacterium]|nr:putative porin [Pyrinomonadaceae bacterium]
MKSVLLLAVVAVAFACHPALAQEQIKPTDPAADASVAERVRLLESELERQNSKLDQLQKTIADQQQAIQALLEKLSAHPVATTVKEAESTPKAATETRSIASTPPPAQTVEQRLAQVESDVKKIGPIRLSGDFRLRFDGIFRSATEPPDPPLEHIQNARVRYRFRLNLDANIYNNLTFHAQLATGPVNNPLSTNQDFTSLGARPPFSISEIWVDYRPTKELQLQAGRVPDVFADNSRFLFDDDIRFNGFNERYTLSLKPNGLKVTNLDFRAGQYILTNPVVAVVQPNSALARAGAVVGSTGRSANLFHQGLLVNQTHNERWSSQWGGDIQLFRQPNQIQLASTLEGLVLLVQPGLGLALSGPLPGTGNATTTPGGAIYTAPGFQVARITYRLNYAGFKWGGHDYPLRFDVHVARNVATGLNERDAMLTSLQIGRVAKRGDMMFQYVFAIKGANALISQLTDDDLGTNTGVNIRTHHIRFDYGISRRVTFQNLIYIQNSLRRSGQYPNFFVPLGDFTPTTYRWQPQLVFSF